MKKDINFNNVPHVVHSAAPHHHLPGCIKKTVEIAETEVENSSFWAIINTVQSC